MNSEIFEQFSNQLEKNIDELNVCRFCLANKPNNILLYQDVDKYFDLFEKLTKIELKKYPNIFKYICIDCTEFLNKIDEKFNFYREINIFLNEFLDKQKSAAPPSAILPNCITLENNDNDVNSLDFTKNEVNTNIDVDKQIEDNDENSDHNNDDGANDDADYDSESSLETISQIIIEDLNKTAKKEKRNQHKCQPCNQRHGTNQALLRHIRRNHNPNYQRENQLICHYCECGFDDKSTLIHHLDLTHRGCALNEMKCNICKMSFISFYHFNIHNESKHVNSKGKLTKKVLKDNDDDVGENGDDNDDKSQTKETKIKCKICNVLFSEQSRLDTHMKIVHTTSTPLLVCEMCGNHFQTRAKFKRHLNTFHSNKIDPNEKDLRIRRLTKYQARNERLKLRRERAIDQPKQQCPFCPSQFIFIETFRVHMKKKHGTAGRAEFIRLASYCCQTCNIMFDTEEERREHRSGGHPCSEPVPKLSFKHFQCWLCKQNFSTKDILERHVAKHSKKPRPFKCSECELTFTSKSYMDVHYRCVHTDERPFPCQECDRRYATLYNLNKHVRFGHRREKRHKCSMCDQKFHTLLQLRKHEIHTHSKEYPYTCPIEQCGRKFTLACGYAAHMQRIHKQIPP